LNAVLLAKSRRSLKFLGSDACLSGVTCEFKFFSWPAFFNEWLLVLRTLACKDALASGASQAKDKSLWAL
jgi:hypothetical protein